MWRCALLGVLGLASCTVAEWRRLVVLGHEFGLPIRNAFVVELPPPAIAEYEARGRERQRIARAVVAGTLSADEAAEAIREVDGPDHAAILFLVPGQTTEEKMARRLIALVSVVEDGGESAARRLEEGLDRRLTSAGR